MGKGYSRRTLIESMRVGGRGLAGLAAIAAIGAAAPAGAISWDDAGNSASKLWTNFGNWSPDGSPAGEPVFIGNFANAQNDTTLLDAAFTIDSLSLTNGADIVTSSDNGATNDFQLTVTGLSTISGTGSTMFVIGADGDGFDTAGLTLNSGGTLNLNSTTNQGTAVTAIRNVGGRLNNNDGGTIIGQGRIDFDFNQAGVTTVFTNNGTITANTPSLFFQAPAAGTLRINDVNDPDARFDWDGLAPITAAINVNGNQTLDVDISTGTDAWSGDMNLFTGSTLDMRDAWSMDSGTIDANTAAFGLIIIGQDPNPGAPAVITGANWTMSGGTITVDDSWDSLELDSQLVASGGTINNSGHLIFNNGATIQSGVDFNMIGAGAKITVNGSSVNIDTPNFDLDASAADGNVTTINDGGILDLDLGVGADTSLNHDIIFNNGGELDVTTDSNTWTIASNATVTANGTGFARLNGEALTLSGDVTANDTAFVDINATTTTSALTTFVVNAGATIDLQNATYNGGTYTGAGIFRPGTKTIASATTFSVDILDMDDGNSTVNANLTINADQIDSGTDGIDGTTTIANDAVLTVNINGGGDYDWDGILTYNGDATENTFLAGSDAHVNGTMNINGDGASSAVMHFDAGSVVNINTAADGFRLEGGTNVPGSTNTISGATINGPGELRSNSGVALRGFGTINAPIDFDGTTSQLIAEGGTLTLTGGIVDIGTIGTVTGGTLNVTTAWNTAPTNTVRLDGGTLTGALITNDEGSGIEGEGSVVARVINNTVLEADSGGILNVTNTLNDWDGAGNTGTLRAINPGSILRLDDSSTFLFNGTVTAQNGGIVFADTFELEFDPASTLNLTNGGTYRSTNPTDIGGAVIVSTSQGTLNISGTADFESTSTTTLNANLLLDNAATNIQSGATFSGAGRLINAPGRTLRLQNNADVGVLVENRANFELANGQLPARGDVNDFVQTSAGSINIDIGGAGIGQFDRLFANGNAQLAGDIDLTLTGGFLPAMLDSFTVINSSGLIGAFESITGGQYAPGLALVVTYSANNVVVTATIQGDLDVDGDVDDADFGLAFAAFTGPNNGPSTNPNADLDADGDVDDADFGLAFANFTGPGGPATVPEPTSLALLALGGLGLLRRRRA